MNSSTTLPSLNALTAGIDWIPNACERRGLASVSTLTSSTWPSRLATAFSITGAERAARAAPLGPEVDDHGLLEGALDDVALEGLFGGVDGHDCEDRAMDFADRRGRRDCSPARRRARARRSCCCTA